MDYETITKTPQAIGLEGVTNDRQLGGYTNKDGKTIKSNVLLRTAHLHQVTPKDITRLQEEFKLATVIDFRASKEIQGKPDVKIDGTRYVWLNLFPSELADNMDGSQVMHADDEFENAFNMIKFPFDINTFYINILSRKEAVDGYRKYFDELLSLPEDSAILFHCTAGKDRTGIAAALLMSVLDIDEETILQDYMLTNEFNAEKIDYMVKRVKERTDDPEMVTKMEGIFGVKEESMSYLLKHFKENYGSTKAYVQQVIGVNDAEIEQLKNKFLQ